MWPFSHICFKIFKEIKLCSNLPASIYPFFIPSSSERPTILKLVSSLCTFLLFRYTRICIVSTSHAHSGGLRSIYLCVLSDVASPVPRTEPSVWQALCRFSEWLNYRGVVPIFKCLSILSHYVFSCNLLFSDIMFLRSIILMCVDLVHSSEWLCSISPSILSICSPKDI